MPGGMRIPPRPIIYCAICIMLFMSAPSPSPGMPGIPPPPGIPGIPPGIPGIPAGIPPGMPPPPPIPIFYIIFCIMLPMSPSPLCMACTMFIRFPMPPICLSMPGSITFCSYCIICLGFLFSWSILSRPSRFIFPIRSTIFAKRLCSPSRNRISLGFVPLPFAILTTLDWSIYFVPSSSSLVMESITYRNFLILSVDSFSCPFGIILALKPGIIPTTLPRLPMLSTD